MYTISEKHLTLKYKKLFLLFNNFDFKKITQILKRKMYRILLHLYSKTNILVW